VHFKTLNLINERSRKKSCQPSRRIFKNNTGAIQFFKSQAQITRKKSDPSFTVSNKANKLATRNGKRSKIQSNFRPVAFRIVRVQNLTKVIVDNLSLNLQNASFNSLLSHVRSELEVKLETKFSLKTWQFYRPIVVDELQERMGLLGPSVDDFDDSAFTDFSEFSEFAHKKPKRLPPKAPDRDTVYENQSIHSMRKPSHPMGVGHELVVRRDPYGIKSASCPPLEPLEVPDMILKPHHTSPDNLLMWRIERLEQNNKKLLERIPGRDRTVDFRLEEMERQMQHQAELNTKLELKLEKLNDRYKKLKIFADELSETNLNLIRGHRRLEKKNSLLSEVLQEVTEKLYVKIRKLDKEHRQHSNSDPNTATTSNDSRDHLQTKHRNDDEVQEVFVF